MCLSLSKTGTGLLDTVIGSDLEQFAKYTAYEATGKTGQVEYGNGTTTTYTYYPESTRLETVITTEPGGPNDIQNATYTYYPSGNVETISSDLNTLATPDTAFTSTPDASHIHAVGTVTMNGTPHTYAYDANGNMTSGPDLTDPAQVRTRTISYNGDNMPAQITVDGNTVDFVYDGSGVRAKKTVNQTNATYYIGKYYEKRNGVITKYIFSGNTRIAKIKGTDVFYFHKDHLGSSTLLTNASGTVVETTEYMPFGGDKTRSGVLEANYKYTDQEYDLETGLYNYRARLYDPIIATFITPDSIVPHPSDPQMLNRYAYCRNNPIKYVDPTGHSMDLAGALGSIDLGGFGGFGDVPTTSSPHSSGFQAVHSKLIDYGLIAGYKTTQSSYFGDLSSPVATSFLQVRATVRGEHFGFGGCPDRFNSVLARIQYPEHTTQDAAANAAMHRILVIKSMIQNKEYAGYIYRTPRGTYSYTHPRIGIRHSSHPGTYRDPSSPSETAYYHTHGMSIDPGHNCFSLSDISAAVDSHLDGYVAVSGGGTESTFARQGYHFDYGTDTSTISVFEYSFDGIGFSWTGGIAYSCSWSGSYSDDQPVYCCVQ